MKGPKQLKKFGHVSPHQFQGALLPSAVGFIEVRVTIR